MTDRQRTPPGGDDTSQAPGPTRRPWLLWLAIVALLLLPPMFSSTFGAPRMPYSTFVQKLDSGLVASVQVGDSYITGTLKTPDASGEKRFVTNRVDPSIADQLRQHGVPFSGIASGGVLDNLVLWLIPAVLFVAMWWFLARRTLGQQPTGLFGVGKSKARVYAEKDTKVTFDDVAGVDEAKEELREVVAFLKNPERLRPAGRARAQGRAAGRAAGHRQDAAGPRRGRRGRACPSSRSPARSSSRCSWASAPPGCATCSSRPASAAPCIIFIDELDALGRARGAGRDRRPRREGADAQPAPRRDGRVRPATGHRAARRHQPARDPRPRPAARRALRPPGAGGPARSRRPRRRSSRCTCGRCRSLPDVDLDHVAALTPGFTGADLANLVNEAALLATRRGGNTVALDDFTGAVERIVAGLEQTQPPAQRHANARSPPITRWATRWWRCATAGQRPRAQGLDHPARHRARSGYTMQRPTEDRYLIDQQDELEGKLAVLLGGRAAELTVFGELSTGAADDLVRATQLARDMVTRLGMDETVGHVVYGQTSAPFIPQPSYAPAEPPPFSNQTAREIEVGIRRLLQDALGRALAILAANRESLDVGAHRLIEKETLTRDELPPLVTRPPTAPTAPSVDRELEPALES